MDGGRSSRDDKGAWTPCSARDDHRLDDEFSIEKLTEIESGGGDGGDFAGSREGELADDRRRGGIERAAEAGAVRLVGMTGQDAADIVAGYDRFQDVDAAHDEARDRRRRGDQPAAMVEDDQRSSWSGFAQLILEPGELLLSQSPTFIAGDRRI